MGLDMYLYVSKYESCSKYDQNFEERRTGFYPEELQELADSITENNFMSKTTQYQVAYWRKANQIHNYFVNRCADGEDDCREVWVSLEALEELVALCREVIAKPEKAKEELPTRAGFFFGDTDYDEYYIRDLEQTVEMLEPVIKFLKENKNYEAYYRASW
jgi:hypothetical protein